MQIHIFLSIKETELKQKFLSAIKSHNEDSILEFSITMILLYILITLSTIYIYIYILIWRKILLFDDLSFSNKIKIKLQCSVHIV